MKIKKDPPQISICPPSERNLMIFNLVESGESAQKVAKKFNLSKSRVYQIHHRIKFMKENYDKWPLLRQRLSNRTKHVLRTIYGDSILENPHILIEIGRDNLLKIKNIGIYTLRDISSVLMDMKLIKTRNDW